MDFTVRTQPNHPDTVEVRYDCSCGCKPRARYQRGSSDAGHEHCCCGRVHFVGAQAFERLQEYLAERRTQGRDLDLTYAFQNGEIQAPWGEAVVWAYAEPSEPQEH